MNDKKCNGWSNYATWKVNAEILSDMDFSHVTYDYLEEIVEHHVFGDYTGKNNRLMYEFAQAFIAQVDFRELAEHINADVDLQLKYEQ